MGGVTLELWGGGSEVRSWSFGDVGKGEGRVSSAGVMRHATVCKTARPVRLLRTRSAEYSRLLVLNWASFQGGFIDRRREGRDCPKPSDDYVVRTCD